MLHAACCAPSLLPLRVLTPALAHSYSWQERACACCGSRHHATRKPHESHRAYSRLPSSQAPKLTGRIYILRVRTGRVAKVSRQYHHRTFGIHNPVGCMVYMLSFFAIDALCVVVHCTFHVFMCMMFVLSMLPLVVTMLQFASCLRSFVAHLQGFISHLQDLYQVYCSPRRASCSWLLLG